MRVIWVGGDGGFILRCAHQHDRLGKEDSSRDSHKIMDKVGYLAHTLVGDGLQRF